MTGALHVLQLQLSPPLPSFLAAVKPAKLANPGSPGKMAVKTESEIMKITSTDNNKGIINAAMITISFTSS